MVDHWWQTETGGCLISNLAGVTPAKASWATLPLPGVQPLLVDEKGNEFNRLEWELDSSDDFEEKFHIFYDDSTDITLVAGNGLLLSTNEDDIETQANEMELYDPRIGQGYYEVEIDGTLIYYIWDPNA